MKKSVRILSAVVTSLVLIFLFMHFAFAAANPSSSILDRRVLSALATEEKTEVLISLRPPSESRLQASVASEVLAPEKVKKTLQDGTILLANLTREEIEQLARNPRVAHIQPNARLYASLQDSASIVNASLSWSKQVNAINLTGLNQTICLIDTGINYTHPALGGCYGNNTANAGCKVLGGYDFVNSDNDPTDDNGHGTHAAGIIAASGPLIGIAPDAKLLALKILNENGTGYTSDLISAINWCTGNASIFNITAMSISLGDGLGYGSYCNDDSAAASINTAVAKNITVVVASGNNGNYTGISSPACIQNATAVSSVTKADAIASYANRNSLMQLFAPGSSINSTMISSPRGDILTSCGTGKSYCALSGTSMAAPHVAGAIALLSQYLRQTGQNKTWNLLVSTLNRTGKQFYDASSQLNYSRINIYAAIVAFDITAPAVTLLSPANASVSLAVNQSFQCNATDLALKNVTFSLWNSSSVRINATFSAQTGAATAYFLNVTNLSAGTYTWNCEFTDENNNIASASSNATFTISSLLTTLVSPTTIAITNANQTFQCNATSNTGLSNVTLYLWNSTSLENTSFQNATTLMNTSYFYQNLTREDNYTWNCLYTNNLSIQSFASANFSFTYDLTPPILTVRSPTNDTWLNAGRFNITLSENGSCSYSLTAGLANASMIAANSRDFNATNTTLVQNSTYIVNYYCNDTAGNTNLTTMRTFFADMQIPNVTLLAPAAGYAETASSTSITFNYTVADMLNLSNCSLYLNQAFSATNATAINQTLNQSITQTLSSGSYDWNISCVDTAGNIGASATRSLTITAPASASSSSSGGGGGGGGGTTTATYTITATQVTNGYSQTLAPADKVQFTIPSSTSVDPSSPTSQISGGGSTTHTLSVDTVGETFVNLTIRSDPIHVFLTIGQSEKLNLTSPLFYDLYVKLESITDKKANITLRTINEPMVIVSLTPAVTSPNATNGNITNSDAPQEVSSDEPVSSGMRWLIAFLVLLVIIAGGALTHYYFWKDKEETEA